jgi:hypothetical protein
MTKPVIVTTFVNFLVSYFIYLVYIILVLHIAAAQKYSG